MSKQELSYFPLIRKQEEQMPEPDITIEELLKLYIQMMRIPHQSMAAEQIIPALISSFKTTFDQKKLASSREYRIETETELRRLHAIGLLMAVNQSE